MTPAGVKKSTKKSKKRVYNLKEYKERTRGQLQNSVRAGFDNFLVNLTELEFLSLLTFIYKMT